MILEERGLTQKWLAQKMGCAERKISEICNNKRRITASFALELERVFGISAEFWMSMQSKWDVFIIRREYESAVPSRLLPPTKFKPTSTVIPPSAKVSPSYGRTYKRATKKKRS